jgi:hypothetical protein
MSLNTLSNCRFVTVSDDNFDYNFTNVPGWMMQQGAGGGMPGGMMNINRGFGLTTYEKYESSCQPYNEGWNRFPEALGPMHMAARAFAILAVVFGVIAMIISWCMCCIACDIRFFNGLGITYGCIAVFQVLAFLFFGADLCKKHECAFASAAGLNIAAIVLWAVASFMSFLVPPFDERDTDSVLPLTSSPIDEKNVTEKITEVINADGTKVITREVRHADGSKVVETTKIGTEVISREVLHHHADGSKVVETTKTGEDVEKGGDTEIMNSDETKVITGVVFHPDVSEVVETTKTDKDVEKGEEGDTDALTV